jgi:hypothetical protein
MFTLENVFEKRAEFENACKDERACEPEFKRLVSAKTKVEFMQVILDNFYWVYRFVDKFGLEYDYVDDFAEGFARVNKDDKWGFLDTSFKEICELKYDYVDNFCEGFADVEKDGNWGKLYPDGRVEF